MNLGNIRTGIMTICTPFSRAFVVDHLILEPSNLFRRIHITPLDNLLVANLKPSRPFSDKTSSLFRQIQ